MEQWLEWARGPAFRFSFVLMILGLIRVFLLNVISIRSMIRRAGDGKIPAKKVFGETLRWVFPFRRIQKDRMFFAVVSVLFHLSIIVTPIFLGAHILLWERGLGVSWPAIGQGLADWLTLLAVATALILFVQRIAARATRALSRLQDFLIPLIIAVPFASGYLAMHPDLNPFSYDATMFVHVMSGNLIFILIPFSKLSHVVLFSTTQLISEAGWHLVPGAGAKVAAALGKEDEPL
jgi:nitrate reductase gamma subunit